MDRYKTKIISIRVTPRMKKDLEILLDYRGDTMSAFLTRYIRQYLNENEKIIVRLKQEHRM